MMTRLRTPLIGIAIATACCMTSVAPAAMMTYPDMMGETATFLAPEEQNIEEQLLYHEPTVLVDTLYLLPNNFGVQVAPGPGADLIDSEFKTTIMAKPGYTIKTISFDETGDYSTRSTGVVQADLAYHWTVLEVNNVPVDVLDPQESIRDFRTSGTSSGLWDLDFDIDLTGTNATKVLVTFNNRLQASADDALSWAFIKKKQTGGIRVMTMVPEPSAIVLLGFGALAVATAGRRRRPRAA